MDVSIIIVNYNTEKYINNCIESILKLVVDIDYEIIVVDNGSAAGSLDDIELKYPSIRILKLGCNPGFGTANNRGAEIAKGRNLFLLNPDTILLNNAVKILSDTLDQDPTIGVCGGNLYDESNLPTHSFSMILPGLKSEFNLLFLNSLNYLQYGKNRHFNTLDKELNVAYITGADMMMSKQLYEKLGGFDEDFFMYYEETELSYRVHKMGLRIVSNSASKIIHLEGKSFTHSDTRARFTVISRKKYLRKRYDNFTVKICNLIHLLACVNFIVVCSILGRKELLKTYKYHLKNVPVLNCTSKYKI